MESDRGGTRHLGDESSRLSPVHIVTADIDTNWILGRYATILKDRLGWTVGPAPRAGVALNFFMPYLLLRIDERPFPTKVGAWFTHLEEQGAQSKVERWHWSASKVDIRLCQAQQYHDMLAEFGPTVLIPTPVDSTKFMPCKLRVGVAGRVYADTLRKGEQLVEKLVQSEEFEVVGAGQGWACPTTMYPWERMQEFYQSLDVFLITSLVEGGPDTVLESLACGVPVVGPTGVGMLDEMPILGYEKGDYDSMVRRLRALYQGRVERWRSVADRTEERFARAYEEAIRKVL